MNKGALVRHRAMEALLAVQQHEAGSQQAVRAALMGKPPLEGRDAGLLTEFVYGVLRRQRALDRWIGGCCDRGLGSLEERALLALRVGCYQLAELTRVPDYAALDATTTAAGIFAGERKKGFVHGVLRNLARSQPWQTQPTADMPRWITRRIEMLAETAEVDADSLRLAFGGEAPLHIHTLDQAAVDSLFADGVELAPVGGVPSLWTTTGGAFFASKAFLGRRALPQDAGSAAIVHWLGAQRGEKIADVCAGRGAKSWSLAATGAHVTAVDVSADKLRQATRLVEQSGNALAATIAADLRRAGAGQLSPLAGSFDRVLVDAPCTGLGTVRRRPEIRHRRRAADILAAAQLQRQILPNAARLVAPGGLLLYAVCSMTAEEGAGTIGRFLASHPQFEREPASLDWLVSALDSRGDLRTHPLWRGADAFYAARLRRQPSSSAKRPIC